MPSELPSGTMLLFVGLGVFALIFFAGLFLLLQKFRAGLATELKQQIASDAKPTSVDVKQPLVVKAETRAATFEELQAVIVRQDKLEQKFEEALSNLAEKLDEAVKDMAQAGEDRVRRIHERSDNVLAAVSRVEGELKRLPCDRCTT